MAKHFSAGDSQGRGVLAGPTIMKLLAFFEVSGTLAAPDQIVGRLGIITKSKEGNIDYFSNISEATRLDGFH